MDNLPKWQPNKSLVLQLGTLQLNKLNGAIGLNAARTTINSRTTNTPAGSTSTPITRRKAILQPTQNPWQASVIYEDSKFKVRFNLGTINNVCASNWDEKFDLPTDDSVKYAILTITSANGKITGVVISLESVPMSEDFVTKDTPPPSHKILLGVVSQKQQIMIEDTNLNAVVTEVFRESKTTTSIGSEPFSRYWRWQHTSV
jgi:hypothetical protein